jgi:hypothetical protein
MEGDMEFVRRIGPDPHASGDPTPGAKGCPDVWELDGGDIAIIGINRTAKLSSKLPGTASCGSDEQIVVVPRGIFDAAAHDWVGGR